MNLLHLTNRKFELPADGWYQLIPLGEFPHHEGITQVIGPDEAREIVDAFNRQAAADPQFPGILVDYDHFSHDSDKSSEAAGWVQSLAARPDGVWGQIDWSDSGEAAVAGGRYRLVSPVLGAELLNKAGKRARVLRLLRVALTNDPHIKGMVPLSNCTSPLAEATALKNRRGCSFADAWQDLRAERPEVLGGQPDAASRQRAAVAEFRNQHRCGFVEAWTAVRALEPDLFR